MNTLNRAKQLQNSPKKFAVRVIKAFARLPKDEATRIIGRQFLRSGTSLAANYRASCRARSAAGFISNKHYDGGNGRNAFLVRSLSRIRARKAENSRIADVRV
jgi:hypothetical protein